MPTPVKIDTVNSGQWTQNYANATHGPFVKDTSLYALLSTNANTLEIFKSLDGGVTWSVQDVLIQPVGIANGGVCFFDSTSGLIWVSWNDSGSGAIQITSFDTTSDLWSLSTYTGPVVGVVRSCIVRIDNTVFVISETGNAGGTVSGLEYDVFDIQGLAFTVSGDLAPNILLDPNYSANVLAGNPTASGDRGPTSPANNIWFGFMTTDSGPGIPMNNGVFFSSIDVTNFVTSFSTVPNQIGNPQPSPQALRCSNGPFMGPPIVCFPSTIIFGVAETTVSNGNFASLYLTTDFGGSWTLLSTPGIDSGVTTGSFDNAQFTPMGFFDGVTLTMVYSRILGFVFPSTVVRLCSTVPDFGNAPSTWVWTASNLFLLSDFPGTTPGTDGLSFPMLSVQSPVTLSSVDLLNGNTFGLSAWMLPVTFPVPPIPPEPTHYIDPTGIPVHHLPFCHRKECIFS